MTWVQNHPVTLASGRESAFKVECDDFPDDEMEAHCDLLALILPPFGSVHGVPTGGLRVQGLLERHADPTSAVRLVVDDVWTTGGSMRRFMRRFMEREGLPTHRGAVLFARGPVPTWVTALWNVHPRLWNL